MGPITVFDKSAFQALSNDEHYERWRFLYMNTPPVLVYEVLGDLTKDVARGKRPADQVAILASKFIGSGGPINAPYLALAEQDLIGNAVPMTRQIIPDNFTQVGSGGVVDLSPLNESIMRWSQGHFAESEAEVSALWRKVTRSLGFTSLQNQLNQHSVVVPRPDGEDGIVAVADQLLDTLSLQEVWVDWAVGQFMLDDRARAYARRRWRQTAQVFLEDHAPYAHHCLRALLSLVIAVRHRHLHGRSTHLVDLQYLYYLPFCQVLASDDRVHRLLAPQLIGNDQSFVRGSELKAGLRALRTDREGLSEGEKKRREWALGSYPPPVEPPVLHDLWLKHMLPWTGEKPAGNMVIQLTDEERALAMQEARRVMGMDDV